MTMVMMVIKVMAMVMMVTIPCVTTGNDGAQLVDGGVVKIADHLADKLSRLY